MSNQVLICGVKISFPEGKKPFPQQLALMQKIVMACSKREHALLESPTGTGKTLALLCASLSWQKKDYEESILNSQKLQSKYEQDFENLFQSL